MGANDAVGKVVRTAASGVFDPHAVHSIIDADGCRGSGDLFGGGRRLWIVIEWHIVERNAVDWWRLVGAVVGGFLGDVGRLQRH